MTAERDPWHFQRWAWSVTVGNVTGKACLAYLAKCADPATGRCEAKQTTIATAIEASPRAVRDHLASLEGLKFVARRPQRRVDGGRRNDEFLLLAPGIDEWPDGERLPDPPADPAGGSDTPPGVSAVPDPPAGSDTPPGVSAVPGKKDHQGSASVEEEEEARVRVPSGAHPDLAAVLARLDPAIREGRLTDPQMDGGVRVLDDALLAHGLAVVTAVLDHVVAWLNDPNQRTGRPSHISRMFPTALDKVRQAGQAGRSTAAGDAAGRPPWEDAFVRLRSVFFDGREHPLDLLDALGVDEADLALATLVAEVGTGDWASVEVAIRQGQETQPGRVAVSKLRKAWTSVVPNRQAVIAALDAADQAVWKRCRVTGLERDQLGVQTPPRRDWGQS